MDRNILVYVDLLGTPHLAGRLWACTRSDKEGVTFQYAACPIILPRPKLPHPEPLSGARRAVPTSSQSRMRIC